MDFHPCGAMTNVIDHKTEKIKGVDNVISVRNDRLSPITVNPQMVVLIAAEERGRLLAEVMSAASKASLPML